MPDSKSLKIETNIAIAMRDGVTLYADIYRPNDDDPFPTILQRTPYDKTNALSASMLDPIRSAKAGFAVVIQDTRGRHVSEGEFYAFRDDIDDGYDTVEWAAAQPWSNGNVGMYGASYVGATQWLAATSRPPHLKAIAPTVTASNYHDGWTYQGGAFELGFNMKAVDNMTEGFGFLPTKDFPELDSGLAKYYYDWLAHPDFDDYWKKLCIEEHHSEIEVPALHTGGWYDIFLGGTIRNYLGMKESGANETARSGQRLVIGPWAHGARGSTMAGRHYFGIMADPAATDIDGMHLRWFDHWLNDGKNGITEEAPVRIFVMGDDVWREEQEWPLARAQETKYYLHSGGKANSKNGDGSLGTDSPQTEPPDVYLYNPADPVPTTGGALCCNPYYAANGAYDQNEVEERQDVLVYSTPPLERDVEVTGPVTVTLWASTSATDTDFTAKLVDVCENGCARNLTDGIIRARYRDSMSNPTLLEPGKAYCYDIDLWATSNVFKAGHQIRLEISSSNFPRFDRNTNTGNIIAEDTELRPALQAAFHDGQQASYVSLAIVPR